MPTDNTAEKCGHHIISRSPLGWWCVSCGAQVEGWPDKDADRDALIAWAADVGNAYACDSYTVPFCVFCNSVKMEHAPDCLHERAKALRGDDESTRGRIEEE